MAVIVKYVVVRDGKEDMMFSTRKEAEAYDKTLDIAERLYAYLQQAPIEIPEEQLDELAFFMAQHRDPLGRLLKGARLESASPAAASAASPAPPEAAAPTDQDETATPRRRDTTKRPRGPKPKAA